MTDLARAPTFRFIPVDVVARARRQEVFGWVKFAQGAAKIRPDSLAVYRLVGSVRAVARAT
jgi:hypothetical protein